jgi:hypothetical protein
MNEVIDEELITVSVSMSVEAYELLLAHAKVIDFDPDYFVESLVELYSKDFTKRMMEVR